MNTEEKKQLNKILIILGAAAVLLSVILTVFFRTDLVVKLINRALFILEPFLWGFAIAYILHPVCMAVERFLTRVEKKVSKKHRPGLIRTISVLAAIIFLFAVIVLLLLALLPQLIASISSLISQLPGAMRTFQDWVSSLDHGGTSHEIVVTIQEAVDTLGSKLENFLQTDVLPNLQTLVTNVTSSFMGILGVVKNIGLGCIISAYILGSWEKFIAQAAMIVYAVFPKKTADWIRKEAKFTDKMFSGFIHGKVFDSLIVGVICFVFCVIARMPYAILVSVIVGVTNIIPFFGPYLGAIPSALLILTVSPIKCLIFLVFIILLQQFDGNYLGPLILGDRLGISGIWILFSILVFSSLWGIIGMLIGVPVFAVIYDLISSLVASGLRKRGQEKRIEKYDEKFHSEKK